MPVPRRFYLRTILGNLTPLICDPTTKPPAPPDGAKMVDWLDPQQYRRVVEIDFVKNMVRSLTKRTGLDEFALTARLTKGAALPGTYTWYHPAGFTPGEFK